ncbi:glycosyltransferase [Donghicola eburneus]|uniref:glycosyltransferase n=1 Tax=Donghicola eburneus TaxID=393278 RepID=UPI0008E36580|nr:glycosyltransferase [Donghicola eburneus]SFQ78774.1 Glycosyltransferase involved in cell wall bisynthesis [Donghicola eburneus]
MSNGIRVSHVIWGYLGGGVDSVLDSYLQADEFLPERVCSHVVIVRPLAMGTQKTPKTGTAFDIVPLGRSHLFRAARETAQLIKENESDVVFLNGFNATILGFLLRRLLPSNMPILSTYHGTYFPRTIIERVKAYIFDRLERRFIKRHASAVIAVSQHSAAVLKDKGVPEEKLRVLHNGISPDVRLITPKTHSVARGHLDSVKIITVSRLNEAKGIDVLLHAFSGVAQKYSKVELEIVGSGELEDELKSLAVSLGVSDRVHFLGNRKDIADLLYTADIFAMTSRQENHSVAILEAMRAGLPLVVTDVGGNSESIQHGQEGFLVADLDNTAAEERICELICSPDLRARMGHSARKRFETNFQSGTMIENLHGIISEFVDKK